MVGENSSAILLHNLDIELALRSADFSIHKSLQY